jgi:hypothetical protein
VGLEKHGADLGGGGQAICKARAVRPGKTDRAPEIS